MITDMITDVTITFRNIKAPVLGYVDFVICDSLLVHGARIVQPNGMTRFVSMPHQVVHGHCPACRAKVLTGTKFCAMCGIPTPDHVRAEKQTKDVIHPINSGARERLTETILKKYDLMVSTKHEKTTGTI